MNLLIEAYDSLLGCGDVCGETRCDGEYPFCHGSRCQTSLNDLDLLIGLRYIVNRKRRDIIAEYKNRMYA